LKHKEKSKGRLQRVGVQRISFKHSPQEGKTKWLVLVSAEVLLQFPERVEKSEW
jgi:hypothetical protein